ncbi:MAG: DUF4124 domain-containing protein [Steroidobacteraceae bacterium]
MRIVLTLAMMSLLGPAGAQEIYRWVDEAGVVHYADQPGDDSAEQVFLPGQGAQPATPPPAPSFQPPPVRARQSGAGQATYQSLQFDEPAAEATFFGGNVSVNVSLSLRPALQAGHTVAIFVDGRRAPGDGLATTLTGLDRGTHVLRAAVLDRSGRELFASPSINIYVRQPSVATPATARPPRPPTPPSAPRG